MITGLVIHIVSSIYVSLNLVLTYLHVSLFSSEPERAERERKGDLDRYERLDGDRNLTTELLAVKKVHNISL